MGATGQMAVARARIPRGPAGGRLPDLRLLRCYGGLPERGRHADAVPPAGRLGAAQPRARPGPDPRLGPDAGARRLRRRARHGASRAGSASSSVSSCSAAAAAFGFGLSLPVARTIARIGLPTMLTGVMFSLIYMLLVRVVGRFGTPAIAALGVGHKIEGVSYMICIGFGLAAETLVGQNLGAGQPGAPGRRLAHRADRRGADLPARRAVPAGAGRARGDLHRRPRGHPRRSLYLRAAGVAQLGHGVRERAGRRAHRRRATPSTPCSPS